MSSPNEEEAIKELEKRDFVEELKPIFSAKWVEKFVRYFLVTLASALMLIIITNYIINYIHTPRL